MMFGDVIEKKPVSIAKAKDILNKVKKKNYEQNLAFEYASKFAKVDSKKEEELVEELTQAGIPRIKPRNIIKLLDIMPKTAEELRAVFAKEDLSLSKADTDRVIEILGKYR